VLSKLLGHKFKHAEQSLRVVEVIENNGRGLNLTWEVRDGIVGHSWAQPAPATPEAWIVRFADRIAYLNHDLNDAVRAGLVTRDDVPAEISSVIGRSHADRINALVMAVVEASTGGPRVQMLPDVLDVMDAMRKWMFEHVYLAPLTRTDRDRAIEVIETLYRHYSAAPDQMPLAYQQIPGEASTRVADYVSGMTDPYALKKAQELAA
jgi:dGTPase